MVRVVSIRKRMDLNKRQTAFIQGFFSRFRQAFFPPKESDDDRGRMKTVLNNLILHLHPTKVVRSSLKLSYTWGLGGLSALLMLVLGLTGILLTKSYTPSPDQAYYDILNLRTSIPFGELIRNIHHWAANLMIITTTLHMLRVFYTGAYRLPRALNWFFGVSLLVLILMANFTGYLLPWDQLAFWAITVATSLVTYIPVIGTEISRILLGGPEVGAATLLNFYSLHIAVLPPAIFILMSYHFWRVRKDGGITVSRKVREEQDPRPEKVTTIPHLLNREIAYGLVWLGVLLGWSMLVPAPLEGIANPNLSPNPAKAAWYFLGLQELILHFHPIFGAVLLPGAAVLLLVLLPFYDHRTENEGIYFRSLSGRGVTLLAVVLGIIFTPAWLLADEYLLDWSGWMPALPSIITTGAIPTALVLAGSLILDRILNWLLRIDTEERVLFWFTFLFTALVLLTIVGIFFRGAGMRLYLPWNIPPSIGL